MTTADASGSEGDVLLSGDTASTTEAAPTEKPADLDVLLADDGSDDASATKPSETEAEPTGEKRAPEAYEWPEVEGYAFDQEAAEAFAREHDLTQDQAAALLQREADAVKAAKAADVEAWNKQVAAWRTDARKEFGAEYDAIRVAGNRALTKYADKELVEAIKAGGWQNFPPLIRLLAKVGKDLGEGQSLAAPAATRPKTAAEIMYPSMFSQG